MRSSAPTKSLKSFIGKRESDGPSKAIIATNVPSPAPVPSKADFQSRAVPAAKTIVVASTASTAHARNTEINSANPLMSSPYLPFLFGFRTPFR
ncbi:unannotated protein [freshwater metagenome]|uniref:Unannotated protein n=1 Tax=freshwater metagenome TaxID=449393 RepID=A0A6J6Y5I3_9ZZZZ